MPESKGRSGKKPKYQIADIGGPDLTSEDISTERVLNFLIKGEMGSSSEPVPIEPVSAPPKQAESSIVPGIAEPTDPSEHTAKKSLSHLFERAGGAQVAGREPSVPVSENQTPSVPFPHGGRADQLIVTEEINDQSIGFKISPGSSSVPDSGASVPDPASSFPQANVPTADSAFAAVPGSPEFRPEFGDQVERWKSLYRLNSGEISAMKTLVWMSGENEQAECYVKMRKLAELSNLDYRYCQKVVRSLERLGWIVKLQEYDASTQLGVLYRINSRPSHLT
ncbi:MAG: hypothetical protein QOJ64_2450 [Acidobacteriota bacterium]|jgi:hypothetical protein|nr:hypothetical protein [Acidobacteriota bacterium]